MGVSQQGGPSPRAWGLRSGHLIHLLGERSIPTCVGFTPHLCLPLLRKTVHPHVRGVYLHHTVKLFLSHGPSPRAWGLPFLHSVGRMELMVHPHVRGVYPPRPKRIEKLSGPSPRAWGLLTLLMITALCLVGPSPRAWGLQIPSQSRTASWRSIPTCVGFTTE